MTVTILSSREFNQDASGAKKAARRRPVFITDRGRPSHVLMSIDEYQRLAGGALNLAERLVMPGGGAVRFTPPSLRKDWLRPVDLE